MKWTQQPNAEGYLRFQLSDSEETVCTVKFQPGSTAVRITYDEQKRNFIIRKKGLLKTRTLLENEYGVMLASLLPGKNDLNSGLINLPGNLFHYTLSETKGREITLFAKESLSAFATCSLPGFKAADTMVNQVLLLVFCWYLGLAEHSGTRKKELFKAHSTLH